LETVPRRHEQKAEIARRLQLARTSVRRILLSPIHQLPASKVHLKRLKKTMASNPDFDLDKLLRKAIRSKHLIRLVYQNKVSFRQRCTDPREARVLAVLFRRFFGS
jgi:hypothetical protein